MVRTLEYHSGLTLEEAAERFDEVNKEFRDVKAHYSGFFERLKGNRIMSPKDAHSLAACIGVLLPLAQEDSVQEEVVRSPKSTGTLHYKTGELSAEISYFLAGFSNTGVSVVKGLPDL